MPRLLRIPRNGKSESNEKGVPGRMNFMWDSLRLEGPWSTWHLWDSVDERRGIMTCVKLEAVDRNQKIGGLKATIKSMMFLARIMGKSVSFKQGSVCVIYDF